MSYIQLGYNDLILPALLVVMNGALSLLLHLRLEWQLAVASARMVVQLVLVGYVLTFLFAAVSPFWIHDVQGMTTPASLHPVPYAGCALDVPGAKIPYMSVPT